MNTRPQTPRLKAGRPRDGKKLKKNAGISLSVDMIEKLDRLKGERSRSSFVEELLLSVLENVSQLGE